MGWGLDLDLDLDFPTALRPSSSSLSLSAAAAVRFLVVFDDPLRFLLLLVLNPTRESLALSAMLDASAALGLALARSEGVLKPIPMLGGWR